MGGGGGGGGGGKKWDRLQLGQPVDPQPALRSDSKTSPYFLIATPLSLTLLPKNLGHHVSTYSLNFSPQCARRQSAIAVNKRRATATVFD